MCYRKVKLHIFDMILCIFPLALNTISVTYTKCTQHHCNNIIYLLSSLTNMFI